MQTTNDETMHAGDAFDANLEELEVPDEALERVESLYHEIDDGTPMVEALDVPEWICPLAEVYARQLFNQGKFERALELVDGVIALDERRYYPYLLTGLYLLQEKHNFERAADFLAQAKKRGPESDPAITYHLAEAFLLDGEVEHGVAQLQETLERTADDPDHHLRTRTKALLARVERHGEVADEPRAHSP